MIDRWPDWIREDVGRMVSVDVETSGPNPGNFDLLSIGACTLLVPQQTFYVELRPDHTQSTAEAQAVHGLDLEQLKKNGEPPEKAMRMFADWLKVTFGTEIQPLFLGFNAPFDWMFVNDYFHRCMKENPFGHSALDIKSYYMGSAKVPWSGTSMRKMAMIELQHNALEDAIDQAKLFEKVVLDTV